MYFNVHPSYICFNVLYEAEIDPCICLLGSRLGLAPRTLGTTVPPRKYELGASVQRGEVEPVPEVLLG